MSIFWHHLQCVWPMSSSRLRVPFLSLSSLWNSLSIRCSSSLLALRPEIRLTTSFWKLVHSTYYIRFCYIWSYWSSQPWSWPSGTSQIHVCSSNSLIGALVAWSLSRHASMKSWALFDIESNSLILKFIFCVHIFRLISLELLPLNKVSPDRS